MPKTLYDKIWDDHLVNQESDGTSLLYVDRHLIHEVTSPQAFEGLRMQGRKVRKPELTLAVPDHNVPTSDRSEGIKDKELAFPKTFQELLWLKRRSKKRFLKLRRLSLNQNLLRRHSLPQ